jgi:CubicO group peptidase (beta-lactamase class C family)
MKTLKVLIILVFIAIGCNFNEADKSTSENVHSHLNQNRLDTTLSALESEPANFGWMQGFPPPIERRLSAHDGSFFRFPALRYSVVRMREFMPTTNVSRGSIESIAFSYQIDKHIDSVQFMPWGEDQPMTWSASLLKNYTDGIIVVHRGVVVYEQYFADLDETRLHAVMSVTKSITGTLASVLVADGLIDENKLVKDYVPDLTESAFGDATLRQVMDMTTGLKYSENYADPNAEVWAFSAAGNPWPKPKDYTGPVGYYEYLQTVEKEGGHGEAFGYKTVNSDVLGWVIAKATGKSVAALLEDKIWTKLGMELDSYFQIDALGTPFAGGGFNAGLRDLARFGELIRNKGRWQNQPLIPEQAVVDIHKGGSKDAFARSNFTKLKGWSYRNMWWITHNEHGAFAARGVHGQTIYIDPMAEMVIVRLASHPVASNSANDPFSLPAYHALANYLMHKNNPE